MSIIIRENIEAYMQDLKKWLLDTSGSNLEEMDDFFSKRVNGYEEHMTIWKDAYCRFAKLLPQECEKILDLGCGTGLELDEIWKRNPDISVVGIDLCQSMLDKLSKKNSNKKLKVICEDYFQYEFGMNQWDAVISFESLHHFMPDKKVKLYKKIFECLKVGGKFILGDYIACCDEEEELLKNVYIEKRKNFKIPVNSIVHFDIPLTLEHELDLLREAGFIDTKVVDCIEGATIIVAQK